MQPELSDSIKKGLFCLSSPNTRRAWGVFIRKQ